MYVQLILQSMTREISSAHDLAARPSIDDAATATHRVDSQRATASVSPSLP